MKPRTSSPQQVTDIDGSPYAQGARARIAGQPFNFAAHEKWQRGWRDMHGYLTSTAKGSEKLKRAIRTRVSKPN